MRILVTGSSGFIGSHLCDRLELQAVGLDRRQGSRTQMLMSCQSLLYGSALEVDFCYHLASTVGVSKVLADPAGCIENIVESTKAVLYLGVPGIYFSTSEVYGQNPEPLSEDSAICLSSKSRWSYACAKLCGEWMALQAGWKVVRLFNVIGPRQSQESGAVVPTFVRQALAGEPITVYGEGTQIRTFIDVRDCVELLDRLRDVPFDVLNVGGNHLINMFLLATLVKDVLGSNSEIVRVPYEKAYSEGFDECVQRIPDLTKLKSLVPGFKYRDIEDTILSVAEEQKCTSSQLPHLVPENSLRILPVAESSHGIIT